MATEEHPDDLQKLLTRSAVPISVLLREIRDALKDLKESRTPEKDIRERKTEAIVLRSALTVHEEIAAHKKACQAEMAQNLTVHLELFRASHILPLVTRLDVLNKDIAALCSDVEVTHKDVRNGHHKTDSSMGTVQQMLANLNTVVFGRKRENGKTESVGISSHVQMLLEWMFIEKDKARVEDARKNDFRYYLNVFLKIVFWMGPFVLSAYATWQATK